MNDSKGLIKILVVAGGAFALWWYLQQSGLWAQWFGGVTMPATPLIPSVPVTPVTTTTPPVTTAPVTTSAALPASYVQAASAMMKASGSSQQNFDGWSYYWQNAPAFSGAPAGFGSSGSISPNMIDAMIAAGGGNRSALITASQWVQLLWSQQQAGISGFGFLVARVPQYGWLN